MSMCIEERVGQLHTFILLSHQLIIICIWSLRPNTGAAKYRSVVDQIHASTGATYQGRGAEVTVILGENLCFGVSLEKQSLQSHV